MAVDGIATVFAVAMQLALERRVILGGAPAEDAEKRVLRNENQALRILVELLQNRLKVMPPKNRPHFRPQDRLTVLRLIWSGMWSVKDASSRLVLSRSTINRWLRIFQGAGETSKVGLFFGKPPWNKLADAVRDLIRDCRLEFPEPEIGVRTIVAQIVRVGVSVSRSTARRVLRTPPKDKTADAATVKREADEAPTVPTHHILKPTVINRTWHVDLTTFRVFWLNMHVLAILDGFSRRLLTLNASLKTPTTVDVRAAFKKAVVEFGPRRWSDEA
jgi:transposase